MAFTFIQSAGSGGSSSAEPVSKAYTSNVTAGSLLIAAVFWLTSSVSTCSVSDGVNGAWTAIGSPKRGDVGSGLENVFIQMFYKTGAAAGATTVTADISVSVNAGLAIHEYGGTSPEVDGTPVYDWINSDQTPTSSAITTTAAGTLLFAMGVPGSSVSSAGAGYVLRQSANFASNGTEDDLDGGAAGSKTAGFTMADVTETLMGFVAFKEVTAADTGLAWITA